MPKLKNRTPTYRLHRQSGQAIVTLDGRDFLLGPYNSDDSRARYDALIAEWLANGRRVPSQHQSDGYTVAEILALFLRHAEVHYRRMDGSVTSEYANFCQAMRPLRKLFVDLPANDFSPKMQKATREEMIRMGWSRTYVNAQIGRTRHVFGWAVEDEYVSGATSHALTRVNGLQRGRTLARETERVKPALEEHIHAVEPYVSRQVWALIQLQLHTAARPGEIVGLRPIDLDRRGEVWEFRPVQHKTAHHEQIRIIWFGPKAQAVLKPYWERAPHKPFYSPAVAERERLERQHAARKTPLSCGNRPGTNRKKKPKRQPREAYDVASYRRAIDRACKLAGVPKWHPHQLRHNAATRIRAEFGLEATSAILGHRSLAVTEIYSEMDMMKAVTAMLRAG